MSIQSEINRISTNIENAYNAVATMGGTLPSAQTSENLMDAILSITGGTGGLEFVELFNGWQNAKITINNYKDYKFFIVTVASNLSSESSTFPALVIPAKYIATTGTGLGFSVVSATATTNITYRINRYSAASESNYVSITAYAASASATTGELIIRSTSSGTGYFKSVIGIK